MSQPPDEIIQQCNQYSRNARNKAAAMDCPELLATINQLTDLEKRGRMGGKGLLQRLRDYSGDAETHPIHIKQQSKSLRTYMREYKDKGCGDPPNNAEEALKQADEMLKHSPAQTVITITGAGAVAYGTYRVIRFLPSVVPPLWWTLPGNLAMP